MKNKINKGTNTVNIYLQRVTNAIKFLVPFWFFMVFLGSISAQDDLSLEAQLQLKSLKEKKTSHTQFLLFFLITFIFSISSSTLYSQAQVIYEQPDITSVHYTSADNDNLQLGNDIGLSGYNRLISAIGFTVKASQNVEEVNTVIKFYFYNQCPLNPFYQITHDNSCGINSILRGTITHEWIPTAGLTETFLVQLDAPIDLGFSAPDPYFNNINVSFTSSQSDAVSLAVGSMDPTIGYRSFNSGISDCGSNVGGTNCDANYPNGNNNFAFKLYALPPPIKDTTIILPLSNTLNVDASHLYIGDENHVPTQSISISPSTLTCANLGVNYMTVNITYPDNSVATYHPYITLVDTTSIGYGSSNCSNFISCALCASTDTLKLYIETNGPDFSYNWTEKPGETWINPNSATPEVINPVGGDYFVTVTSNYGCSSAVRYAYGSVYTSPSIIMGYNDSICSNEQLVLNAAVYPDNSPITWTGPGSGWSGTDTYTVTVDEPVSGNYSAIVSTDCGSDTVTAFITVHEPPEITYPNGMNYDIVADPGECFATFDGNNALELYSLVEVTGTPTPQLVFSIFNQYPVGTHTISGNADNVCATVSADVTLNVYDTEPPEIHYKNIDIELVNGQASVTSADVDDGTTDNCQLFSLQVSPIDLVTFDASNLGLNLVQLTATDIYGNQSNELAVVNVVNDLCLNGDDGVDSDGGGLPDDCDCSPDDAFNDKIILREEVNTVMDFDGTNDHLYIPNATPFNPSETSSITFEAWIKPDLTNQFNNILSKGHGGGGQSAYIFTTYNFTDLGFYLGNNMGGGQWFTANTTLDPGVWLHVAVSYDHQNNSITFYINGEEIMGIPVAFTPYSLDTNPTYIGRQGFDCNCNLFKGMMDEVRIWSTARSEAQISNNLDKELKGNEKGLLSYYNFNQGLPGADNTGLSNVKDQAPYGHDASLSGFTQNGSSSNWVMENLSLVVINKDLLDLCKSCPETTNSGIDFDGTDDFITIQSQPELAPSTSNSITLEAWIKPDVAAPLTILSKGVGFGPSTSYIFSIYLDKIGFYMGDGVNSDTWLSSQTSVQYGVWNHVAVSFNSVTNTFSFYLNGNLDGQYPAPHGFFIDNSPIFIGRQGSVCNCNFFNGQIDDVRIWGVPRSASQIQADMDRELFGNETGLLAYFDFNKGLAGGDNSSLTIATDVSFNENNGVLNNFSKTGSASNWVSTDLSISAPKKGAIDFDGADDFINVANDTELIPTATNAVTFEAWIYPGSSSNELGMITSSGAFPNSNHQVYFNNSTNKVTIGGTGVSALSSNTVVPLNTWTHIAVVFNMTETQLYINGVLDNIRNQVLTANNLGLDITFGNQAGGTPSTWNFEGKMDNIRYWNHARTPSQIQENMLVEIPGTTPGLELCFNFNKAMPEGDNTSITIESDVTGNAHDGTLNNFARSGNTSNYVSSPHNFYDGDQDGTPDLCDYCIASKKLMLDNISLDGVYRAEEEIILGAGLTIPINGNVLFRTPELKLSDAVTLGLNKSIMVVSETCVE